MKKHIIIGSRGSKLALWQAHFVAKLLENNGLSTEIKIIKTKGDLVQDLSFDKLEGKGFFTKELEEALLNESIDLAVHSMKDLPSSMPEGLVIAGVSEREDYRDVLILQQKYSNRSLPLQLRSGAVIGTSSIRRKAGLLHIRQDITFKDIRGNVPTRLNKLVDEDLDGIVLAAAGIKRLEIDLSNFATIFFHPREFVPAPAQGVLAYQCRENDKEVRKIVKFIHHTATSQVTNVERKVLKLMNGGCQIPLGVHCDRDASGNFHCHASYTEDISKPLRLIHISQSTSHQLAERIVDELTHEL